MKREPTENRQRQIADAALRLVAAHGLARLTTSAIAREVGLTEGAIFRHFASKEGIVLAAIDRIEELFDEGAPSDAAAPLDRLRRFIEHRVRVVHDNGGIPRLLFSDELALAAGEVGSARVQAIRKKGASTIRRCLDDAQRAGSVPRSLDIDAAALVVQGAIMAQVLGRGPRVGVARVWSMLERMVAE